MAGEPEDRLHPHNLRPSSARRVPGRYHEAEVRPLDRVAVAAPNTEFNKDLARLCAFPSLPLNHPELGPSESLQMELRAQSGEAVGRHGENNKGGGCDVEMGEMARPCAEKAADEAGSLSKVASLAPYNLANVPSLQRSESIDQDSRSNPSSDNSNQVQRKSCTMTAAEIEAAKFLFNPDMIDWSSDDDHDGQNASHPFHNFTVGQFFQGGRSKPIEPLCTLWDDLPMSMRWVVLKTLNTSYCFSEAAVTLLRLTRRQIQEFLDAYINEYKAWQAYEEQVSALPWTELLYQAAREGVLVADLIQCRRPALPTDRISLDDINKGCAFLHAKGLDRFAAELNGWLGITSSDFVDLAVEWPIFKDCLDYHVLKKAVELGWLHMNDGPARAKRWVAPIAASHAPLTRDAAFITTRRGACDLPSPPQVQEPSAAHAPGESHPWGSDTDRLEMFVDKPATRESGNSSARDEPPTTSAFASSLTSCQAGPVHDTPRRSQPMDQDILQLKPALNSADQQKADIDTLTNLLRQGNTNNTATAICMPQGVLDKATPTTPQQQDAPQGQLPLLTNPVAQPNGNQTPLTHGSINQHLQQNQAEKDATIPFGFDWATTKHPELAAAVSGGISAGYNSLMSRTPSSLNLSRANSFLSSRQSASSRTGTVTPSPTASFASSVDGQVQGAAVGSQPTAVIDAECAHTDAKPCTNASSCVPVLKQGFQPHKVAVAPIDRGKPALKRPWNESNVSVNPSASQELRNALDTRFSKYLKTEPLFRSKNPVAKRNRRQTSRARESEDIERAGNGLYSDFDRKYTPKRLCTKNSRTTKPPPKKVVKSRKKMTLEAASCSLQSARRPMPQPINQSTSTVRVSVENSLGFMDMDRDIRADAAKNGAPYIGNVDGHGHEFTQEGQLENYTWSRTAPEPYFAIDGEPTPMQLKVMSEAPEMRLPNTNSNDKNIIKPPKPPKSRKKGPLSAGGGPLSRNHEQYFGMHKHHLLSSTLRPVPEAYYAWTADEADFAAISVQARFAYKADRLISTPKNCADFTDQALEEVRATMKSMGASYDHAEYSAKGMPAQTAGKAKFAGCVDWATYALQAEEAHYAFEVTGPGGDACETVGSCGGGEQNREREPGRDVASDRTMVMMTDAPGRCAEEL